LLEADGVELAGLDANQVARRARDDPVRAARLAQGVDVYLERAADACGRLVPPHRVDQPVDRDRLGAMQQEERQNRSRTPSAQRQGGARPPPAPPPRHSTPTRPRT